MRLKRESRRQRVLCGHESVNVERDQYKSRGAGRGGS